MEFLSGSEMRQAKTGFMGYSNAGEPQRISMMNSGHGLWHVVTNGKTVEVSK
jgi:hypothetical protein